METALNIIRPTSLTPSKKARIITLILLLLWTVVLIYPFFSYRFPPPEQQGILIAFGETMEDVEESSSSESQESEDTKQETDSQNESLDKRKSEQNTEAKSTKNTVDKSVSKPTTEVNSTIAVAKKTQSTTKKKKGQSTDRKTQNTSDKKAKSTKQKASNKSSSKDAKKAFSSFFNKDKQNAQKSGSDKGVPSNNHLKDSVTGQSNIGEGLAKRGIIFQPEIVDNSQKTGKVVIRVCVDANGKVISAKHTLQGSTTTDRNLVRIAEQAAKKYVFSPSGIDKQCGKISIDFKLE